MEKLQYLQSALTGEAANKIKILTVAETNYRKAWDLLEARMNNVASLNALGVNVGSEILVNILENKLPTRPRKNCNYTNCIVCQKRHNALLHLTRHPPATIMTE
ncbi:hypothetical protein ALC53_11445 [Atta colombica]|uniref:Uncharacterized protein n=1 Tax=Atta colombica TaxID=520822 RepID=A0A151HZK5_9HYME|nr:hypothetical protein ALC53_11445 [Atta colombica]